MSTKAQPQKASIDSAGVSPSVRSDKQGHAPAGTDSPGARPQTVPDSVVAAQTALMRARAKAAARTGKPDSTVRAGAIAAALVAGIGIGGAIGAVLMLRHQVAAAGSAQVEAEQARVSLADDMRSLKASVDLLRVGVDRAAAGDDLRALDRRVAALREGVEKAKAEASGLISQLGGRVDRMQAETGGALAQLGVQIARLEQADRSPAPEIASLGERMDRLERQGALLTTASLPSAAAAIVPAPAPAAVSVAAAPTVPADTGASTVAKTTAKVDPLKGWAVREVFKGIALLEGPGGFYEVARGDVLPGIGRIDGIERQGRNWVVVTSRGTLGGANN